VIGPISSTAGHVACFNDTSGFSIRDCGDATVNITAAAYGGKGDNSTDNVAAWNLAKAALPSRGGTIYFPPGQFRFNTAVAYTFSAGVGSLTVQCAGPDVTELRFPNSTDGFDITSSSAYSQIHFRDCAIETGANGGGNGMLLTQSANLAGAPMVATSDITNVVFHGIDGYAQANYWTAGVKVIGWSNVDYINTNIFGTAFSSVTPGPLGYGVWLQGNMSGGADTIAAVHNFMGDYFSSLQYGIIYGTQVQGVTVNQSNFTTIGIDGILVGCPTTPGAMFSTNYNTPASCAMAGIDQLTITNNQFGYNGGPSILSGYNIAHLMIANNLIYQSGVNYGIDIYGALETTITGNTITQLGDTRTIVLSAFTGAISGTTLTASSVTNAIKVGDTLYASPIANFYPIATGTTVSAQLTGPTGGAGTYTVSVSQTVTSRAMNSFPSSSAIGIPNAYGSSQGGTISGNQFTTFATGISLSPSATNFVVSGNRYDFIGTKVSAPPYAAGVSQPINSVCDAATPWTVALFSGATQETVANGLATYMRCGNLVHYTFAFNNPTIGGTGVATIQGFPFTATNDFGGFGTGTTTCGTYAHLNSATGITGTFTANAATLNLVIPGAAATTAATQAVWNNNSTLQCSGVYYTDAP
jgi:hypothetical protein